MMAGALAGSATVLLTNPIWVVNTRMTARKRSPSIPSTTTTSTSTSTSASTSTVSTTSSSVLPTLQDPTGSASAPIKAPSTLGTIKDLYSEGGIGAFFKGVLPALVLVMNPILQYTIFEQLKNVLERRRKRSVTPQDAFVLGALGKLVATALTYPYITVKSRLHVAAKGEKKAGGLLGGIRGIVREEGWMGLYNGELARGKVWRGFELTVRVV